MDQNKKAQATRNGTRNIPEHSRMFKSVIIIREKAVKFTKKEK